MAPEDRDDADAVTKELAADVAITRARLASDVEALGAKLDPQNLKQEAKLAVTDAIVRRSARLGNAALAIARSACRHPIPLGLALLGIGVVVWRVRRA
jgi:hypothetical protein